MRQDQALGIVRRLVEAERAGTSAQCLVEFYRVVTQRLPEPVPPRDALAEVDRYAAILAVLDLTVAVGREACRGSLEHKMAVWDALVWSSAKLNQIPYVLTEDAEHGRTVEGVTYLDPFDTRFDLAVLLT